MVVNLTLQAQCAFLHLIPGKLQKIILMFCQLSLPNGFILKQTEKCMIPYRSRIHISIQLYISGA
jgi:hypothetical protein